MPRNTLKASRALLLVVALAPSLCAGNTGSRVRKVVGSAAGAGAVALATAAAPASAAALYLATPAGAPAKAGIPGLWSPYGPVSFKTMAYNCPGAILEPRDGFDLEAVDTLAIEAEQAYAAAGCEPLIAAKQMCVGPDNFVPPAGVKTMGAKEYMSARMQGEPKNDQADRRTLQGQVDSWAIGLEAQVCRALGDFKRDQGNGRHAALFQRLLESGDTYLRLQKTQKRAAELQALALGQKPVVEKEMLPKQKAAQAKERLAIMSGRAPQAQKARLEARQAQSAMENAQYEVDTTTNIVGICNRVVDRFSRWIWPILTEMEGGELRFPDGEEQAEGAGSDED